MPPEGKSLGAAIDEIISALEALDAPARLTAIKAACEAVGLTSPIERPEPVTLLSNAVPASSDPIPNASRAITNIRSFKEEKQPASAIEMACVLAYFLQNLAPDGERKGEITSADVDKYFKQASYPLPKRSDQLLVNTKAAGYLDSASWGAYKLNAVGHNLVAHSLPRSASHGSGAQTRSRKKSKASKAKKTGPRKAK